jgi:hypothetical protein
VVTRTLAHSASRSVRYYSLYGVTLACTWQLPAAPASPSRHERRVTFQYNPDIRRSKSSAVVAARRTAWNEWWILADGRVYFEWPSLFECEVSADGTTVMWSACNPEYDGAIHTNILGHVLSFALVRLGDEPLHTTALETPHGAVALIGDTGYGKSTLAASMIASGDRLITDDLLVLRLEGINLVAYPGLPRLKLDPSVTRDLLGDRPSEPLAPRATKRIVPLVGDEYVHSPVNLDRIYLLQPPSSRVGRTEPSFEDVRPTEAHIAVSAATFNAALTDERRLERQFRFATTVCGVVPVRDLHIPDGLDGLGGAREAILADLG